MSQQVNECTFLVGLPAFCLFISFPTQVMYEEDDRITRELYAEGGSNYTSISSLAWRYGGISLVTSKK